ncbi:PAS domain S-box protein [Hephaestia sp. GCM10023244]|uniref:PAS domain S-box protein n=1 Tax=unclassified Hephaestia TaxID=2631281 RepID=UPI0020771CE1|nr:PAS domain S-box protein [Hephaestia sp. MAHUQ-44]MCM8732183.1 PAS domain S-box protein [Hephaestia sp. MAHUQ-44]
MVALRLVVDRYAWSVVAILLVTLLRIALGPWLDPHVPYTLYLPVILAVAAFRGTRAAIFAAVLGAIAGTIFVSSFKTDGANIPGLVVFGIVSVGIVVLTRQILAWRDKAIADQQLATRQATKQAADARVMIDELTLLIDAAANHAIYFLDADGTITLWSPSAQRITGWSAREAIGQSFDLVYTSADRLAGKAKHVLAAASRSGRFRSRDVRRRRDGSIFIADITLTALLDDDGGLRGFGLVMEDVTDEARAAEELELRERQLRSILATVPEATIITDNAGTIVSVSGVAQSLFGYAEADIMGCDASMLLKSVAGETQEHALRFSALAEIGSQYGIGRRVDGTVFPIQITVGRAAVGENVQFTGFIRDLSSEAATRARLAALQAQILHMSRVSAMGTMAATLAHELNQPLAAVESYIGAARNLMRKQQPDSASDLDKALAGASSQALRAATIIRRTREMLARRDIEFVQEDLAGLLAEAKSLACMGDPRLTKMIDLSIEPGLGAVLVDKIQVQQVVLNLLRNAVDAVCGAPVRKVVVSAVARDDDTAEIIVSDTGRGLSPDEQVHLFDTFFSTKANGLGVGLPICRTIVEVHGGRIWASTRIGSGTELHFTLRRAERGEMPCKHGRSTSSTTTRQFATPSA